MTPSDGMLIRKIEKAELENQESGTEKTKQRNRIGGIPWEKNAAYIWSRCCHRI